MGDPAQLRARAAPQHRTVAKALNAAQEQWENLWSAEHYHSLELASDEDVIDKIAYVAANPTEAGRVESPEEWPGVMLLPEGEVRTLEIRRPGKYFTNDSVFPFGTWAMGSAHGAAVAAGPG